MCERVDEWEVGECCGWGRRGRWVGGIGDFEGLANAKPILPNTPSLPPTPLKSTNWNPIGRQSRQLLVNFLPNQRLIKKHIVSKTYKTYVEYKQKRNCHTLSSRPKDPKQ